MDTDLSENEEITRQSYDKHAAAWSSYHSIKKFWGEEFDRFYGLLPAGKLLEVGCGAGRDAKELIQHGYDYVGTDISTGLLELARKNNPQAHFEQMSLYDLDFNEKFDGFWCAAVLLHIPRGRIGQALRSIRGVIKPGGFGFIAVKEGDGEIMETTDGMNRCFIYWHDEAFRQVLKDNNFKVLHYTYKPMSEHTKWLIYQVQVQ